jgi:hypothetical protein
VPLLPLLLLAATPLTACSSVTQDDVERAVGRSVARGVEESAKGETSCDFVGKTGVVSVAVHELDEPVNLEAQQRDLREAMPSASFRPAPQGFFVEFPDAGTQLHVTVPPRKYVIVTVLGFGAGSDAAAQSIARAVTTSLCRRSKICD